MVGSKDFWNKIYNAIILADRKTRERLISINYSQDVIQAFDIMIKPISKTETKSLGITLMDIAWQISGNNPTENELALAFFPINTFFLGTVYQDDLLDSLETNNPRVLVKALSMPTCLIMGNILYCESLLSLLDRVISDDIHQKLLKTLRKLVYDVMDSEIIRRKYIGKILPSKDFYELWRTLTPNRACVEVGGILGKSDNTEVEILAKIGSNFSLKGRIIKEISEMYGLKGSLQDRFRYKPPPLPISLAFESATSSEKKEIENAIQGLSSMVVNRIQTSALSEEMEILIQHVIKYNSIATALKIHSDIFSETRDLIYKISNLEHRHLLNQLLGSEFLPEYTSIKEKSSKY